MFRVAAHTDIGPRKKSNQDSCCAVVAQGTLGDTALLAVCDGVGGLESGELASASVIDWLIRWFERDYPKHLEAHAGDMDSILECVQQDWESGLYEMNDALRIYGRDNEFQLGTTCSVVLLVQGNYIIAHVGDSRVYLFSNGSMEILTTDQTWVAQEVARGNIPPEKARSHPKRNVILQSVGTQNDLQPVFSRGTYRLGDSFMVCCDGFRNELFDDELVETFGSLESASESEIGDAIARTIQLVLDRGERDNITAVACNVGAGDAAAEGSEKAENTTRLNDPDDPKTTVLPQVNTTGNLRGAGI